MDRRTFLKLSGAAVCSAPFPSFPTAAQAGSSTHRLTGQTLDAITQLPIGPCTVLVLSALDKKLLSTLYTDENGVFSTSYSVTQVPEETIQRPEQYSLSEVYPNFLRHREDSRHINLSLPESQSATVTIYNILGQLISSHQTLLGGGAWLITFSSQSLMSGMYFIQVRLSNGTVLNKKFSVLNSRPTSRDVVFRFIPASSSKLPSLSKILEVWSPDELIIVGDYEGRFRGEAYYQPLGEGSPIQLFLEKPTFPGGMTLLLNHQMNNLLSDAESAPLVLQSKPYEGKVNLSFVPNFSTLTKPAPGREWIMVNLEQITPLDPNRWGDYSHLFRITGGDLASQTLYIRSIGGAQEDWEVGDRVALINPFTSGWSFFEQNPIIGTNYLSTWRKVFVIAGGLFRKMNGQYILLVNGTNANLNYCQVGAFASNDLKYWEAINDDQPVFPAGRASWCRDGLLTSGRVLLVPNSHLRIVYCAGYNASDNKFRIGWIKFDESFNSIEYSPDEIVDSSFSGNGFYGQTGVYYDGKYRIAFTDRKKGIQDVTNWQSYEAFSDHPEGPFLQLRPLFRNEPDRKQSYRSSHIDHHYYFIWENRLHLFVGCTSHYKYSGTRGNRVYALFRWDDSSDQWREDIRNPLLFNPIYGEKAWNQKYLWCNDHLGTAPVLLENDQDIMFLIFSANSGTDTYQIGLAEMNGKLFT